MGIFGNLCCCACRIFACDGQLTYLLQNSLSGNSKTLVCWVTILTIALLMTGICQDDLESLSARCTPRRVADIIAVRNKGKNEPAV
jgi:hypothetical protein